VATDVRRLPTLPSDAAFSQPDPFLGKEAGDPGPPSVVADHGGERNVVAEAGKTDGHVGRAAANVFLGGTVRAMHDVDQRLADHQRAVAFLQPGA
jgi:hypothetical protein